MFIFEVIIASIFIPFCAVLERGRESTQVVFVLFFLFLSPPLSTEVILHTFTYAMVFPFVVIALLIGAIRIICGYPDLVHTLKQQYQTKITNVR